MSENKDLLKEARELCAAATTGDTGWYAEKNDIGYKIYANDGEGRIEICHANYDGDAEFIARARTLVPELVELCECQQRGLAAGQLEIDRLKARAEELEARLKGCASCTNAANSHTYDEKCHQCRTQGKPGNHYPLWELAPRRSS